MDVIRAARERRFGLTQQEPKPVARIQDVWGSVARTATIGMFVLMLIAALYFGRALLLPIVVAAVIGETLAPVVNGAAKYSVPRLLSAAVIVSLALGAVGLAVTLLAEPLGALITRAPELGASIKQKLYVFDWPLAALRELQNTVLPHEGNVVKLDSGLMDFVSPALVFLTPAIGQIVLFVVVLFFVLAGEHDFRAFLVAMLHNREAKLRFLRIATDVRRSLAGYVAVVTMINFGLGVIVAAGAWLLGFPNPVLFGLMAMVLNYIPYLGPAVTAIALFAVGLVIFPTLGQALVAPALFVALASIEGHLLTPAILGRQLTLNPLALVLALAFWTWMWGPMGAFIAAPLLIISLVVVDHLFPSDEPQLPE